MQKLLAKKLNKKGFTLAELLIVVAIIAVLVAIAIPIFTGAMEKARLGVHRSNARNLKSMAVTAIMADPNFEASSGSAKAWEVVGSYDFEEQTFSISEIKAQASAYPSPKMFAAETNAIGSWKEFGKLDDEKAIGQIGTNSEKWYKVQINPQDISVSGGVNWKVSG